MDTILVAKGKESPHGKDQVIHTVGPVRGGSPHDPRLLESCYCESLRLAEERGIMSVSTPAISTRAFGYPIEDDAQIALKTVLTMLRKRSKIRLVRFMLHDGVKILISRAQLMTVA